MTHPLLEMRPPATADEIVAAAAEIHAVTPLDILSSRKTKTISNARHLVVYTLREMGRSWSECANGVGKSHHTSAIASHEVYERDHTGTERLADLESLRAAIDRARFPLGKGELDEQLRQVIAYAIQKAPPTVAKQAREINRARMAGAILIVPENP